MVGEWQDTVPFEAHVALLQSFLDLRSGIVGGIQDVLNAQRKPAHYLQDRGLLSRLIEDCFYDAAPASPDPGLKGQLEAVHWARGFKPREVAQLRYDLISPAEMAVRGFHCWQMTRWPGRNGRLRYAQMLFNVYVLRSLELMSLAIWDGDPSVARDRLAGLQTLLNELWEGSPDDQPVLVRDARWLIPLALSPATEELAPYFVVTERVADTLGSEDRIEIARSHVRILGGHLTSQIQYYCVKDGVALDDLSIVLRTRTSNALDFALLVQGLVPLFDAYEQACRRGDGRARLEFAGAILQGVSPDPEVFLNRVDLLGPYSMIEHAFVGVDSGGEVQFTPTGRRHVELLEEYAARIPRLLEPLLEDCPNFRPAAGACSSYGVISGNPTNITELMALKTVQPGTRPAFTLEDAFEDGDSGGDRLAWVNGWRQLPHIDPAVQEQYAYPQQFAEDIYGRIEKELERGVSNAGGGREIAAGRLFVVGSDGPAAAENPAHAPELPARFILSSDPEIVAADKAVAYSQTQLLRDRQEGFFAVSYQTGRGWVAMNKDFLTEVLGAGHNASIAGLPGHAAAVLTLMCSGLAAEGVVPPEQPSPVPVNGDN